jgi:hypothetical protein
MSEGHSITLSPTNTRYSKKQSSPSLSPNMSTNPLQCAGTEFASPYHSEFDEELYHSMMETPRTQGVNMAAQKQVAVAQAETPMTSLMAWHSVNVNENGNGTVM